ncbi:rRNA-processing protein UTP11 [Aspergillus saccharolyticus JOP 1030-1]|uniref:U3 small nucleolar RNA-associated protein 11 n=1 Tax=Aspergillus saccharolyticus JOP 1030-1 TaxID=1450539 RepID=A0A318ZE43_9EURO|nr:hypothetical protein BP01DRAFT_339532 [Aspergillus saccharolyticus JOP 1030-1]PYH45649.1 hypothetical protein BP01DRAFT_339532 [Aspergillus saccharolyticus JOP 1030-1]
MSSTMRNAVQRRNHKERGQLQGREKWGILEKHKDYSLRAKDYNAKKAKLKRLQEKVRDANPDEFHFGMMSSKQGKHSTTNRASAAGLSHDAIKLLKTQDAGYLRVQGEKIRRQLERLEEEGRVQEGIKVALGEGDNSTKQKKEGGGGDDDMDFDFDFGSEEEDDDEAAKPRKVVFAEDREEQKDLKREKLMQMEKESESEEEEEDEDDSFGQRKKQTQRKSRKQIEAERQALVEARRARKIRKRAVEARENKVKALQKQYKEITAAARELDWQRGRMDNVVGGTNKNGVKWKIRERKR